MKNTKILILFIIGATFVALGVILKVLDYSFNSLFLIIGMTFNAVAAFLLILKMIRKNDSGSFMDD
ncbi:hypothetical protein [Flavobacterium luteum]|uniref:Gliding motility protein GldL n=1 Tax=Flavobacterium luteum TaxID=2026654 RepID=A0A7J5AKW4_9FLAO|nr:hypothetical protein [Flavobacterium luteum]KAB1158088.1 hypothetical protein F6464_03130 [Flavobacterium luteum]